jgi:hypothetical protein
MPGYAYSQLERGSPMTGAVQVDSAIPVGVAIEHILLLSAYCAPENGKGKSCTCRFGN